MKKTSATVVMLLLLLIAAACSTPPPSPPSPLSLPSLSSLPPCIGGERVNYGVEVVVVKTTEKECAVWRTQGESATLPNSVEVCLPFWVDTPVILHQGDLTMAIRSGHCVVPTRGGLWLEYGGVPPSTH
jgi:hypothetical protein